MACELSFLWPYIPCPEPLALAVKLRCAVLMRRGIRAVEQLLTRDMLLLAPIFRAFRSAVVRYSCKHVAKLFHAFHRAGVDEAASCIFIRGSPGLSLSDIRCEI